MTIDEFKNQYEFKLVKKALMREFPFVKDVTVRDEEDINKWKYSFYLELVIDPFVMSNMYNIPVWNIIIKGLKRGEPYWTSHIGIFFVKKGADVARDVHKEMETLMNEIHKSPAIPQELKMNKSFLIGSYIVYPDTLPPFYDITSDNYDL